MALSTLRTVNLLAMSGDDTRVGDREFHTNKGTMVKFKCENVKFDGSNGYGSHIQACILFVETANLTEESLIALYDRLSGEHGVDMPIVLCGSDENHLPDRQLRDDLILPYYSTRNSHNLEPRIFLHLAKKLTAGSDELRFVEPPQRIPATQQMQSDIPALPQHAPGSDTTNSAAGQGGDKNCCCCACGTVGCGLGDALRGCYYLTYIVQFFMDNCPVTT